jgi:hypothetical protein
MSYVRSPEHRRLRSEIINRWAPWQHATGPRSPSGKARSAMNRWGGARRARARQLARELDAALDHQVEVLDDVLVELLALQSRHRQDVP